MPDPKNGTKTPPTARPSRLGRKRPTRRRSGEALEPFRLLAEQAQDTHQAGPTSMLIEANRLSCEADRQIIEKLDRIIELLAAPSIEKALRDMLKG